MSRPATNRTLLAVLCISLVARIAVIGHLQNFRNPEDWEYGDIAENIVAGHGFSGSTFFLGLPLQPTSIEPPLYPYLLALFLQHVPHPYLILQLLQVLVSLAAGVVLYAVAQMLFDRRIALWTLAFYGLHPTFIYIPTQFLPLTYYLLHLGIGVYFLLRFQQSESRRLLFWFGVNAGLAMLQDTIFFSLCLAVVLAYWWRFRWNIRRIVAVCALIIAPVAVIAAPWTIRNYHVHGEFVFIKSPVGYNLWKGNHPGATGTARTPEGASIDDTMDPALRARLQEPAYQTEIARDRLLRDVALEFIRSHPGEFIRLSLKRLYYFWWFDPTIDKAKNPVFRISYMVLLIPGFVGVFITRMRWREFLPLYLHAGILTGVYTITMVVPRYHMQIDYLLIPFACIIFERVYQWIRSRMGVPFKLK